MRLTRYTDNALRCLTFLGITDGASITVPEISRRMRMSEDHLFKVIGRLAQLGYVETTRGRSGGVRLAKPPEAIIIGDVVRATEECMALVECFEKARHRLTQPLVNRFAKSRFLVVDKGGQLFVLSGIDAIEL